MRQLTRSKISKKMIMVVILFFIALCCINLRCDAQSTTVSATVVDQASTVWANGTWKLQFVPNPNFPSNNVNWNGNPFPTTLWVYQGSLDGSGAFSAPSIPSNNFITPVGSTYTLNVCPNATSACSVITNLTVQGSTLNLSSTITAATPAPNVKPLPLARAYNDAEVAVNPTLVGYFYQNVTSNKPRYWDGSIWQDFGSSLTSVTLNNFDPLFTVTVNSTDPLNPIYTFHAETELAGRVYANCTGSTANPSFCAITAGMLPGTITSNTSGSAGSLASVVSCTVASPQLVARGMATNGTFICVQVKFSDLSGNIAVSQMDGGTNADASHVWIGSGHWAPFSTVTAGIPAMRTASATGCTTPVGTGESCVQTLTWNSAWADTNYTAVCGGLSPFTSGSVSEAAALDVTGTGTLTTTTINVQTTSKGSGQAASYGTISCIGVHN